MLAELLVGVYPIGANTEFIYDAYKDVYDPEPTLSSPDLWLKIFGNECVTPFSVTDKGFEAKRSWRDDPVIYIFDPSKTTDLIDLWNIRIEPSQLFPVPLLWFSELADSLKKFIEKGFRPVKGNNNGVMHSTTLEISRSISEEFAREKFLPLLEGLPQGSLTLKFFRTRIWHINYGHNSVVQPVRVRLTGAEKSQRLSIKIEGNISADFESLSPYFSGRYSGSMKRWANVLTLSPLSESKAATILPYNTFDRQWPLLGLGGFINGREGWVFLKDYGGSRQSVSFLTHDEAFTSWFKLINITATLSDAGRIAKQVLDSLDGFWGLELFDDVDSIKFINKMATSTRVRSSDGDTQTLEEDFSGRSASIDQWQAVISKRDKQGIILSKYIDKHVIKIGLETECAHCNSKNWHDLDEVSYLIKCSRCLKLYDFPQGGLKKNNRNWKYRVIGPFAVPDYAQGAYASLLTIKFLSKFCGSGESNSTYSTALDIVSGDKKFEIDFAVWVSDEKGFQSCGEPRLVIGEAKSFAGDSVKAKDLSQLKIAAGVMTDSILVISVLKESFSSEEIIRLREFVEWAREPVDFKPRHRVILLTGIELFDSLLSVRQKWKAKGRPWSDFAEYHTTSDFDSLSDATLFIYLDLPPYYEWLNNQKKFGAD